MKFCLFFVVAVVFVAPRSFTAHARGEDLSVSTPESIGMSSERLAEVDRIVNGLTAAQVPPGAIVLVARKGKIAYLKTFGYKDLYLRKPMTVDTIFRIYSMSKAITSTAILMLVEEGKVDLDAPVAKYIHEFEKLEVFADGGNQEPTRPPVVRDLLRHTAGLTYGFFGDTEVDQKYRAVGVLSDTDNNQAFAKKVGQLPLLYDPGTKWQYSVSTDVLGRIVEVASGKDFGEFLQERIFDPLNMADTGFYVPKEKLYRFAISYNLDNGKISVSDDPATSKFATPRAFQSGGGGLVSTIKDYYRFLLMISKNGIHAGERLLSEESVKLMTTNQLPAAVDWIQFGGVKRPGVGFGLGFSVRVEMSDWDTGGRVGEYGWGGAASTHYWVSPKDDLIVITMEQVRPYSFKTEFAVKKAIYDAIESP